MLAVGRLDTYFHIEIKQADKAGFGLTPLTTPLTGIRRVTTPTLDGFHGRQPKVKRKERRAKRVRNKSDPAVTVTDKQAPHPPPG
ncbi:hypothetical protein CFIO01_12206 [Colletotrichum fioriniae PJ7]|uniref:Uncharacterized protein n=1 Tax=Colletotrichum fioriniae PJ7 TaxID=1445577 RepID=A0A010R057_9PEZI|nr:hypothetical protein CFIO01_12206 [Colletotrichum fioriniae PJ7]